MSWKVSKRSAAAILLPVLVSAALLALTAPADARSGGIKYAADYSDMRGFNYNPISARNGDDKWINFSHAEIDRDFGYAERLKLNAVRMFLSYKAWVADRAGYDVKLKDFTRIAFTHHVGVMFVVVGGPQSMMPGLFEESAKPKLREYAQDLVRALGNEPGLVFWDAANEPDWVHPPAALPNTDQANIRVFDVEDGKLKNMRIFAGGISDPAMPGAPDGMKCDAEGNIWVTAPGGLWVYSAQGALIGKVAVPEFVANLHWGGDDWRTLFVTASTSLYAVGVKVGPHIELFMNA